MTLPYAEAEVGLTRCSTNPGEDEQTHAGAVESTP